MIEILAYLAHAFFVYVILGIVVLGCGLAYRFDA